MSNTFAALQESDSDDDASDVSDVEMPTHPRTTEQDKKHAKVTKRAPAQSGGSFAERRDPLTGASMGASAETATLALEFDPEDVEACLRVVNAVGANINLFKLPQLKPLRAALHPLILEQMKNYDPQSVNEKGNDRSKRNRNNKRKGGGPDVYEDLQKLQKQKLASLEEEYINQTQLRALRLRQLEQLNDEGYQPRVPDGVAICDLTEAKFDVSNKLLLGNDHQVDATAAGSLLLANGREDGAEGGARELVVGSATTATVPLQKLINPISCYICHKPYVELHFFYHQLCPACAAFNYAKREEKADMQGKVCLVTGGRTKIGYRSALKLLRCGARVVVTTRFPHDAAVRFAAEKDCNVWLDKLDIYGLDFRDLRRLEEFCAYLQITYERLDVIINNACQTIRRPPAYFQHLIADEVQYAEEGVTSRTANSSICDASKKIDKILKKQCAFSAVQSECLTSTQQMKLQNSNNNSNDSNSESSSGGSRSVLDVNDGIKALSSLASVSDIHKPAMSNSDGIGLNSVQLSQLIVAPGDECADTKLFPTGSGSLDVNRQQVDLRKHNSWTMKLDEVSTPELAEVFAINTMAPTILNSRLKGMMQRHPADLKFIVNVSAMEGKFYRYKSERHPHTNMAKAALNMLTRTSAQDYIKSNIHMTSVDTGWINDEKPIDLAVKHEKKHKFQTPLDEVDAAARVLDPVIGPLNAIQRGELGDPPWGVFLKDYMKCEW